MNDQECLETIRQILPTIHTDHAARFLSGAANYLSKRLKRLMDPAWYVEIRLPDGGRRYEKRQWVTSSSWHDPAAVIHLSRRPISERTYRRAEAEGRTCLYEYEVEILPGKVIPLRKEAIQ